MSTLLLVLFFLLAGLAVVLVAMRSGSRGPVLDSQHRGARRVVAWLLGAAVVLFLIAVPVAVGIDGSGQDARAGAIRLNENEQRGREVFNYNCVQCHRLGASNAVQDIGPNLDTLRPPKALILDAIEKGRARGQGQMPSQLVTGPEAQHVADYIVRVAGR